VHALAPVPQLLASGGHLVPDLVHLGADAGWDLVADTAEQQRLGDQALLDAIGKAGWSGGGPESGIGTAGQYPRQDLIPGNMDDGFHHREDEAVLGVRATRFPAGRRSEAADDQRPGDGKGE
jgi:hypothetical protein